MKLALLLVFASTIQQIASNCTPKNAEVYYSRSIYEFSNKLVSRLSQHTENHFFVSPFSVWTLLATLSLGAEGETQKEILKVIRQHSNVCYQKLIYNATRRITGSHDSDGVALERSSTLFVDGRYRIRDDFRYIVGKFAYDVCDVTQLEGDLSSVAAKINEQVSIATHGLIEDVVTTTDLEGLAMILVDALYFKGIWQTQFSSIHTEKQDFLDEKGNKLGDIDMMVVTNKFKLIDMEIIDSLVLELPYGTVFSKPRFSMIVFLPFFNSNIVKLIDKLPLVSLTTILRELDKSVADEVTVQLPKFKMSSDIDNLKELLRDMGLKAMFSDTADFVISDYPLVVSNIVQKAKLEVNEEGTEAAVITEAEIEDRMGGASFTANRPFLFMIVDKETQVALFTGAFSKPNA